MKIEVSIFPADGEDVEEALVFPRLKNLRIKEIKDDKNGPRWIHVTGSVSSDELQEILSRLS